MLWFLDLPKKSLPKKKSPKKFHHPVKIHLTYHQNMTNCQMTQSNNSESEEDSKPVNPQNDLKFILFKERLDKLLKRCPECGAGIRKKHTSTQGSLLLVTLKCINGHAFTWNSQPMIKRMAAGNLLISSAILLSGATYTKMATLAEILGYVFSVRKHFVPFKSRIYFQ